jgi:hypothetical protein
LWLGHLAPGRPWSSADFFQRLFQKDDFTANGREWTRIRKIVDRKTAGAFFPKARANELPFLQKGSASVSLAVSRILRDTPSIVAALSKRQGPRGDLTINYN